MGGIGFILGGAMQGWGNAQMKVAQDMRDQAFRKEGWAHEEAMAAEDRKFRSQEAEIGRGFEHGENELTRKAQRESQAAGFAHEDTSREATFAHDDKRLDRTLQHEDVAREDTQGFTADESQKDRDARRREEEANRSADDKRLDKTIGAEDRRLDKTIGAEDRRTDKTIAAEKERTDKTLRYGADIVRGEDGTDYVREGDKLRPLTDAEGKAVKILRVTDDTAELKNIKGFMALGLASTPQDAWRMVSQAKVDRESVRKEVFLKAMDSLTKGSFGRPDPVELQKNAQEFTDKAMEFIDAQTAPARGGIGVDTGAKDATAPAATDAASQPPGSGTKEDPYVPRSQADIDWFVKNAKPGAVLKGSKPDEFYTK